MGWLPRVIRAIESQVQGVQGGQSVPEPDPGIPSPPDSTTDSLLIDSPSASSFPSFHLGFGSSLFSPLVQQFAQSLSHPETENTQDLTEEEIIARAVECLTEVDGQSAAHHAIDTAFAVGRGLARAEQERQFASWRALAEARRDAAGLGEGVGQTAVDQARQIAVEELRAAAGEMLQFARRQAAFMDPTFYRIMGRDIIENPELIQFYDFTPEDLRFLLRAQWWERRPQFPPGTIHLDPVEDNSWLHYNRLTDLLHSFRGSDPQLQADLISVATRFLLVDERWEDDLYLPRIAADYDGFRHAVFDLLPDQPQAITDHLRSFVQEGEYRDDPSAALSRLFRESLFDRRGGSADAMVARIGEYLGALRYADLPEEWRRPWNDLGPDQRIFLEGVGYTPDLWTGESDPTGAVHFLEENASRNLGFAVGSLERAARESEITDESLRNTVSDIVDVLVGQISTPARYLVQGMFRRAARSIEAETDDRGAADHFAPLRLLGWPLAIDGEGNFSPIDSDDLERLAEPMVDGNPVDLFRLWCDSARPVE